MTSTSVLSPERRIELNAFDVDAWNLLLRESQVFFLIFYWMSVEIYIFFFLQARPIDVARNFYEKLVGQFHNAGRFWKAYIEHEVGFYFVVFFMQSFNHYF